MFSVITLALAPVLVTVFAVAIWQMRIRRKGLFSPFTDDFFRTPGYSARKRQEEIVDQVLFLLIPMLVLPITLAGLHGRIGNTGTYLIPACIAALTFFCSIRMVRLFHRAHCFGLGAEGEEYTGQELNLLMRRGAFVFHDIPYQYGNIDHVVVGHDKIFAIETKAVRKPATKRESQCRQANVRFDGKCLHFPHFSTAAPCEQARRHAKFLQQTLEKKCGACLPVVPVVALPGWFVECDKGSRASAVMVVNPKRGRALQSWLGEELQDKTQRNRLVEHLASVACSITPASRRANPDAADHYDFWHNPRFKGRVLGD